MKTIDIFGSCVTRDALKYKGAENLLLRNYIARTSIESIYSKRIRVNLNDIQLSSAFEKRCVYWDLNKFFPNIIENTDAEYLILDLIDQRYHLLKTKDSILTRSTAFVKSGLKVKGMLIPNSERVEIFKQNVELFIRDIIKVYDPKKIILHEAYFVESYFDKNGVVVSFEDTEYITESNSLLKEYYESIKDRIPEMKVIKLEGYIADELHEWTLAPYHYEKAYYETFNERLSSIIES